MATPGTFSSAHRGRHLGRRTVATLLVGATAFAGVMLVPGPAQARPSTAGSDITIIQANLLSPQADRRFQRDAAEVLSYGPDLITYNEVGFRRDGFLAPPGYAIYRPTGRYQKPTPVVWRTDRFTDLGHGTFRISNWRGRPPGKKTELGRRWANWVTLGTDDGRTLSLVSTHIAPKTRGMPDLRRGSVARLRVLVDRLAARGPVLVGGDFNMHYLSSAYPEDLFEAADLKSTFELRGTRFATGDHHGATIDYLFIRGSEQFTVDTHFPVELNSDHDAVVAGLSWVGDPDYTVTTVRNRPRGDRAEQRAVLAAVRRQILGAEVGGRVQLATKDTQLAGVVRALRRANANGVRVQVTTRSDSLTRREKSLQRSLKATPGSWVRRCVGACSRSWDRSHPPTLLLVSDASGQPVAATEVSRRLIPEVVERRTRARIETGPISLAAAQDAFRN